VGRGRVETRRKAGARDWSELKAEAVRRAAKPLVAPDGLAEALATAFGLGTVTTPALPVSVTGWLNWMYNTTCESIEPFDNDRARFAERETADLLNRPMTRASLRERLVAVDGARESLFTNDRSIRNIGIHLFRMEVS
jgi:hypothetical protein